MIEIRIYLIIWIKNLFEGFYISNVKTINFQWFFLFESVLTPTLSLGIRESLFSFAYFPESILKPTSSKISETPILGLKI